MFCIQAILSTLVLAATAIPSPEHATLLYATTPGCVPCQQIAPLVREIQAAGYSIETIDASQRPDIIRQLRIDRFPTFLMLSGDQVISRHIGGGDPAALKATLLEMYRYAETRVAQTAQMPPSNDAVSDGNTGIPGSVGVPPAPGQVGISPTTDWNAGVPPATAPLIQSSVKLRVDADNTHSWGTGTIIDARNGEALILTCGHIFRDSQGKGQVEVQLFGPDSLVKIYGICLYYDIEIDIALIAIRPPGPVRAIPIAPTGHEVRCGQAVWSVGCDGGANPTIRNHMIMSIDRVWAQHTNAPPFHYIQVSGAPVSGRSGGGLFSQEGYLIGVCNTADPVENDGHFVPPHIIRQVLQSVHLSAVYEAPSLVDPRYASEQWKSVPAVPAPLVGAQTSQDLGTKSNLQPLVPLMGQSVSVPTFSDWSVREEEGVCATKGEGMSEIEKATLDEIKRRSQDGDEVILIVKSRRNPEMPSDVIVLNGTSKQFLDALAGGPKGLTGPVDNQSYDPVILSSHKSSVAHGGIQREPVPFENKKSTPGPHAVSFPVVH